MLEHSIIKWRCHRGMLELDLFLLPFYDNCYVDLSESEKQHFAQLLEENDVDLLQWFMGYAQSHSSHFDRLIKQIRSYRLNQNLSK